MPDPAAPSATAILTLVAIALPGAAAAQGERSRKDDPVARGAYLATAAGCESCHTPHDGPPYSGGHVLTSQFGRIAVPNVTPDADTGIGGYDDEDFQRAMREGIRPDGTPIYPAMPYEHYTKMRDADIADLWAYIKTVDPARNEVADDALPFPFNVRAGIEAWHTAYFEAGRFQPDPDRDDVFNRGAYLAEALRRCSSCHTPRNLV